jgi:hypothetical protein
MGWRLQRPTRCAVERDEQAIARWLAEDWPSDLPQRPPASRGFLGGQKATLVWDGLLWVNLKGVELANLAATPRRHRCGGRARHPTHPRHPRAGVFVAAPLRPVPVVDPSGGHLRHLLAGGCRFRPVPFVWEVRGGYLVGLATDRWRNRRRRGSQGGLQWVESS